MEIVKLENSLMTKEIWIGPWFLLDKKEQNISCPVAKEGLKVNERIQYHHPAKLMND